MTRPIQKTKALTMVETISRVIAGSKSRAFMRRWLGGDGKRTPRQVYGSPMSVVRELRTADTMRRLVIEAIRREDAEHNRRRSELGGLLGVIEAFEIDREFVREKAKKPRDLYVEQFYEDFLREHAQFLKHPVDHVR